MLSSQPSPCHPPSTFLHSSAHLPSRTTNKIHIRKLHLTRISLVLKVPSSHKLQAVKNFQTDGILHTISDFNHLLMSLVVADEFELALKLKSTLVSSGLVPDNWTYSILVNYYCKQNEPTEAKTILDHMLENRFEPNVATFTTLINSFCEIGRMQDAFEVFDIMSRIGCEPTIITYNCLLKGLCYVGRVEEAYDLMLKVKKSSLKPDIYTYTAVMDGFCKVGRSNEALELLNEAIEMELTPNVVMYNTLFNGYFREGRPFCGFGLLRRMKERNCKPDYISYSTLFHGLLKWGKMKAALGVYREMVEIGFRVDERMMNTLLRGLCRRSRKDKEMLKDVYSVFEEMRNGNYTIDSCAYDLVIEAFCNGKEMGRVFSIFNEMIRIGYSPKTFTFTGVIRALCIVGEIDSALTVLMLMHKDRKQGRIPFSLLINELDQRGRLLDACSVYGVALKRGVVLKKKPSKYLVE